MKTTHTELYRCAELQLRSIQLTGVIKVIHMDELDLLNRGQFLVLATPSAESRDRVRSVHRCANIS